MKNKVVIWGTNAENEKVLIALELKADVNKVVLYTFPEAIAGDDFVNKMMNEWRDGKEVEFPEGHTTLERELSVTESLLPDDLMVERGDIIQRAQTEWHFAVLSAKLHAAYQQELAEFKEKVESLASYDNKVWDSLKSFWDKVQSQSRERNLYREHADNLRDNINALFDDLKKMRTQVQGEFIAASQVVFDEFSKTLDEVEARIAAGSSKLGSIFEDLKQIQRKYRDAKLSNEHRNQLWDRIDGAFKKAKERKFGPAANEGSVTERHERRLGGLMEAIKRMEGSIRRDEEELNFQRKKVNSSEGQLEAQIRTAKIKMIEERLGSKREKLAEMEKTRGEVERQVNSAKEKESRRAEKEAEKQKIEAAKEAVKSEIAAEIKAKSSDKAAPAGKDDDLLDASATVLGDVLMDALDTARAVVKVAAEKAEEAIEKAVDKAEEVLESLNRDEETSKTAEPAPEADSANIVIDDIVHKSETAKEDLESFSESTDAAGTGTEQGIVIDDIVHKSAAPAEEGLESTGGIVIDDIVHKSAEPAEEGLESTGGIVIDDIVHKSAESAEEGLESTSEAPAKPKRTTKKKEG